MKKLFPVLMIAMLVRPAGAQQQVVVDGSRTMAEVNQELATEFMASHAGINVVVAHSGTHVGIQKLIDGTVDVAATSRPLSEQEAAALKQKGGHMNRSVVALEGVSIYLHPKNRVRELSFEQLEAIYLGKVTNWNQLGGADAPVTPYAREKTTGKYWYFKEEVLKDQDYAASVKTAPGEQPMIDAILRDPSGIGYGPVGVKAGVGLARVRRTAGQPAFSPTVADVKTRKYPLIRELAFNMRKVPDGATRTFLDWVLSPAGQSVIQHHGFIAVR